MMVAGCGSLTALSAPTVKRVDGSRGPGSATVPRPCPREVRKEGMIAIAARGHLKLLDLAACRARVLADITATDVRFSPDGRWLAYSRQVGYPGDGVHPIGLACSSSRCTVVVCACRLAVASSRGLGRPGAICSTRSPAAVAPGVGVADRARR